MLTGRGTGVTWRTDAPPTDPARGRLLALFSALGLVTVVLLALGAPARAVISTDIVNVINAERHANGLPLVRLDSALSAGCAVYDNYRRLNGSVNDGFTPGPEQPARPGYTAAGARASHDSLLNAGDRPADSWAGGDVFDDAPGHLFALMDPAVAVIGADQLDFDLGSFFGTAYISCIDTRSAQRRAVPRRVHTYAYIGPDGRLPIAPPDYREPPFGVGRLIFLYFSVPKRATVTLLSLKIRTADGRVHDPLYVRLTGGLRDGRPHHSAEAVTAASPGAKGSSPGVEVSAGPETKQVDFTWRGEDGELHRTKISVREPG